MANVISVKTEGSSNLKVSIDGNSRLNVSPKNTATGTVIKKGYSPYIDDVTGTWWEYDDAARAFVDTGVFAEFIITDVSDEFVISDEKVLFVNEIAASKVDGLVDIIMDNIPGIATETIPGLVLSSADENNVLVMQDGVMVVNDINVNKLVQTPGEKFTLNGGDSLD